MRFLGYAYWRTLVSLSPDIGGLSNAHRRVILCRNNGIWGKFLELLIDKPDYEWLMINVSHCKVYPHAAGAKGGKQPMTRQKGFNTKLHLAVDAHGIEFRAFITQSASADCTQAIALIDEFKAEFFLEDRGCDSYSLVEHATLQGIEPVITPKKNRRIKRYYDKELH